MSINTPEVETQPEFSDFEAFLTFLREEDDGTFTPSCTHYCPVSQWAYKCFEVPFNETTFHQFHGGDLEGWPMRLYCAFELKFMHSNDYEIPGDVLADFAEGWVKREGIYV